MKTLRVPYWFTSAALLLAASGGTSDASQRAETTTIILIGLAVASYAAAYLLRPKPDNDFKFDHLPTTLTTKGHVLTYLIGRDRLAPYFTCAGKRQVVQESVGSGGKGFGSGGGTAPVYYEQGWHLLCLGPATRLRRIYQGGEVLWEGPIDRFSTPSGSVVETNEGSFAIYWGEICQPVNEELGDLIEEVIGDRVDSRWPYFCYVFWLRKRLGATARWNQLEYDIEAGCDACLSDPIQTSPCFLTAEDEVNDDSGINYGHALWQVCTAPWPHGVEMDPDDIDFGSIEDVGRLCASEHTPCRVKGNKDNLTGADVVTDLASDFGFFTVQSGDRLVFKPIRAATSIPAFPEDAMIAPAPEVETRQGRSSVDQLVLMFPDRVHAFKPNDAWQPDDAEGGMWGSRRQTQQELTSITDFRTASKAAERKQLEAFTAGSKIPVKMTYTARNLEPGHVFSVGSLGNLLVTSRKLRTDSAEVLLNCLVDQYTLDASGQTTEPPGGGGGGQERLPDVAVGVLECPHDWSPGVVAFMVARVRANTAVGGASVLASTDGTTYHAVGSQTFVSGGRLAFGLPADTLPITSDGPTFDPYNDDVGRALDLTSDEQAWLSGRQVLLVDDELMLVRSLSADVGGYRCNDVVRGAFGTVPSLHVAGAKAFLFAHNDLQAMSGPTITQGSTQHVKAVPTGVLSESVEPVERELLGIAVNPLAVSNVGGYRRGVVSTGDPIIMVRAGEFQLEGDWTEKYKADMWVDLFDNGDVDGVYRIAEVAVQLVPFRTRLLLDVALPPASNAGYLRTALFNSSFYEAGQSAHVAWDYGSRVVQPFGPYGDPQPAQPDPEAQFRVYVLDPATDRTVRTFETPHPRFEYTEAMRNDDFGTPDPSFTLRVTCGDGPVPVEVTMKEG